MNGNLDWTSIINNAVGVIIPAIIAGGGILINNIFAISKRFGKIDNDLLELKKDNLELKLDLKKVDSKASDIDTELSYIKGKLRLNASLVRAKSPLSLTEGGEVLLVKSGGKKYINENLDILKQALFRKKDEDFNFSSYDIQELSKEVIKDMTDSESFKDLKEYLYKNGLSIGDLELVMGIYLRDKILGEKVKK